MKLLKAELIRLADIELEAAQEKYGLNHSDHESYAVLLEEIEEAKAELHMMELIQKLIWEDIKRNSTPEDLQKNYKKVYERAIDLAIEAIQCAAMARKGLLSNIENNKKRKV